MHFPLRKDFCLKLLKFFSEYCKIVAQKIQQICSTIGVLFALPISLQCKFFFTYMLRNLWVRLLQGWRKSLQQDLQDFLAAEVWWQKSEACKFIGQYGHVFHDFTMFMPAQVRASNILQGGKVQGSKKVEFWEVSTLSLSHRVKESLKVELTDLRLWAEG